MLLNLWIIGCFFHLAEAGPFRIGLAPVAYFKTGGPVDTYSALTPEFFLSYDLDEIQIAKIQGPLRALLRLNPSWTQQSTNLPQAFEIKEYDWRMTQEVAFSQIWQRVSFSLALGLGVIYRITELELRPPIVSSEHSITNQSFLFLIHSQLSSSLLFFEGLVEAGPFLRYSRVFSDSRLSWAIGGEISLRLN